MKESVIRTVVPIVYALLLRAGLTKLGVEDAVIRELATVVTTGAVYVVIRFVEERKTAFGWLLGSPTPPTYEK